MPWPAATRSGNASVVQLPPHDIPTRHNSINHTAAGGQRAMMHFITALPAEARPLIEHFRLRDKCTNGGFPVYRNDGMALSVSGPGKVAAAAATASLAAQDSSRATNAWLNIGIAGHATLSVGRGILVNHISDRATGKAWYPPQLIDTNLPRCSLTTVDIPETGYAGDSLYDMEASGFFPVACRYSTAELVQCFKVVSDNREQTTSGITAQLCERLIADQLDVIEHLVQALAGFAEEHAAWHAPHPEQEQLTTHWHFTVAQQHRLARLAQRWKTLLPGEPLWSKELGKLGTAGAVLLRLEQHLDSMVVELG